MTCFLFSFGCSSYFRYDPTNCFLSDKRKGYRNGTRPRTLTTRVGTITLRVPRFRDGQFSIEMFACYQRSEQALVITLMEMATNGVSTRKVSQITEELCGTEFSKSNVSELCKKLDPIVNAWNNRELQERRYRFVLVYALVLIIREDVRIFPNRESAVRLIGALLMEIDDKWVAGKKYLDMSEYSSGKKSKNKLATEVMSRISDKLNDN